MRKLVAISIAALCVSISGQEIQSDILKHRRQELASSHFKLVRTRDKKFESVYIVSQQYYIARKSASEPRYVFKSRTGKRLFSIPDGGNFYDLNGRIYWSKYPNSGATGELSELSPSTGKRLWTLTYPTPAFPILPRGNRLILLNSGNLIEVDTSTLKTIRESTGKHRYMSGGEYDPSVNKILMDMSDWHRLHLVDPDSFETGMSVYCDPGKIWLVSGGFITKSWSGAMYRYIYETKKLVRIGHSFNPYHSMQASVSGDFLSVRGSVFREGVVYDALLGFESDKLKWKIFTTVIEVECFGSRNASIVGYALRDRNGNRIQKPNGVYQGGFFLDVRDSRSGKLIASTPQIITNFYPGTTQIKMLSEQELVIVANSTLSHYRVVRK